MSLKTKKMITVSEAKQNILRSIEAARLTNDFTEVKKLGTEYLHEFDNYDYQSFSKWWKNIKIDNIGKPKKKPKVKVVDESWKHTY